MWKWKTSRIYIPSPPIDTRRKTEKLPKVHIMNSIHKWISGIAITLAVAGISGDVYRGAGKMNPYDLPPTLTFPRQGGGDL